MMLKQALQVALLLIVSPVVSAFLPPLAVREIATKSACPYSANYEDVRKFALCSRTEAADDTADSIKDAVDDAADSVKSAVDDSKDTIDDIRDDVGEKIKTEETTWEKNQGCRWRYQGFHQGQGRKCEGRRQGCRRKC
jgi:hypothetical protein